MPIIYFGHKSAKKLNHFNPEKHIYIYETGAEAIKRFGIDNGARLPVNYITSIQIDFSVDVQVRIGELWFIDVFDIDHESNTHKDANKDSIQIGFTEEFLNNPIGDVDDFGQLDKLFVERVILNPKNITFMILETRNALSY
jgi:hypothetical protein